MIEPPNVSGESKWGDDKELLDKVVDEWTGPKWVISRGGAEGSSIDVNNNPSSAIFISPGDPFDFRYNTWVTKTGIQAKILGTGPSRGFAYPENGTIIGFPSRGFRINKLGQMVEVS